MRSPARLFACMILLLPVSAAEARIVDRIAAVVEKQIITLSEVDQVVNLRVSPRAAGESEDAYRKRVLDDLIAQSLRLSDVERFGAEEVAKDSIEARLQDVIKRFPTPAGFEAALLKSELTLDELRILLKRQLQVEAYIEERFSPLIFVSLEEIESYYNGAWSEQRRARGLAPVPLPEVREEIRAILKAARLREEVTRWTNELRSRANVDVYTR